MCSKSMASAHMTKIKGGCQLGRKVIPHDSKSDLPLKAKDSFILVFLLLKKSLLNHVDFFSASMVFFKHVFCQIQFRQTRRNTY